MLLALSEKIKSSEDNFVAYLNENKRRGRLPKGVTDIYKTDPVLQQKPYELYNEKAKSRMFFKEIGDDKYTLTDVHIDVLLYYMRKKHIYHINEYPFASTTTDVDFNDTLDLHIVTGSVVQKAGLSLNFGMWDLDLGFVSIYWVRIVDVGFHGHLLKIFSV
ncbi:uncharacterized protein [Nicotiana sylvestris]|uniref:uncharacterized protein isoform X2 n=1 Tax=Nicotiana sylvestris TaxID=4096 RepID=UPI00388C5117